MTPAQLAVLKQKLLDLQAEIVSEGDIEIEPARKGVDHVGDDEDSAPLTEMAQVIASKRNRARTESLARVVKALRRIDETPETFGLCRECEEPIGKRLDVMPYVELCLECQSEQDPNPKAGRRRHAGDFR